MRLNKFTGWRRLWDIFSMSYLIPMAFLIPVALITTYVAYYEGIAQSVGVGILLFAAPVAFLYCLGLGVSLICRDFVNRQA